MHQTAHKFLQRSILLSILIASVVCSDCLFAEDVPIVQKATPVPTAVQLAWQQAELGVVFHYDLHIFDEEHYNQARNRRIAYPDPNIFNPTQLDTDQWVRAAKSMGATFAIFTASHETGFRMWQSDASPDYSLKAGC